MKMKTMLALLAVISLSACCMICSKKDGTFTEADSGKTFATSPGSTLNIDLKGNYTTGYSWNVVSSDKKILTVSPDSKYVSDTFSPGMTGVGGVQHYIFNVVGKGQTELKITYNRVWEKDIAPAQIFTLNIDSK
ncbi:MAG: protease inhibitor I42 family protein [Lentisphaerota bacterium]